MAYKQNPGRSPLEKTGRDIPLNMKSPAYMTDGPGDKGPGDKGSGNKKDDNLSGYKPLSKKNYISDKKDFASQVVNATNMPEYKKDSITHRNNDLRLNELKPGSRVPGTRYVINDFNSETNSFEAREKGTLNKVSISRRDMVNRMKPGSGQYYKMNPKKIKRFANAVSTRNK